MFIWFSKYGIFPYCAASSEGTSREDGVGGPAARRETQFVPETVLSEDECKEAVALMKHCPDEDIIKKKMKLTFDFRRNMVLDPQQSSNVPSVFPRFKDVKDLVIDFHYFDSVLTISIIKVCVYFSNSQTTQLIWL